MSNCAAGSGAGKWCILRTAGPRTLLVATSLSEAGFEVWTPSKIIRRPAPGQRRALVMGKRRRLIDVEVAILPGFVFASADALDALVRIACDVASQHPEFFVFQFGGRVPTVSEASVAGLRAAEMGAAAELQAARDAETREEARRLRAEQLRTDRAKLKALRSERRDFAQGQEVSVDGIPAMTGIVGRIVASSGTSAVIDFGGSLTMKVEAWRVVTNPLNDGDPSRGIAA